MSVDKARQGLAAVIPILIGVLAGIAGAADFKQIRVPFAGQLDDIAVADLNGDRYADIVTIDKTAKTITVLMGSADLAFSKRFVRTYPSLGGFIIGIADFTGDKKLDVAVDDVLDKTYFAVFPGDGTGTLRTPQKVNASLAKERNLVQAAVADFNNDRRPDILGLLDTVYDPSYPPRGPNMLFMNLGGGKFGKARIVNDMSFSSFTAGDFTSDGRADILNSQNGTLYLYIGNGAGAFTPVLVLRDYNGGRKLGQADFNKDKKLDIISGAYDRGWTYLGKGNGRFGAKKYLPNGSPLANGFAIADLTGDTKPDVAEPLRGGILIHPGKGTGGFGKPFTIGQGLNFDHNYTDGEAVSNVAAGDFDKDGKSDLAGAHYNRSPSMTDLMLFISGRPPVTPTIANLNVTNLSFSYIWVKFAGSFTFQTNSGDVKYMAAPEVTDNAYLEFKIFLDFPYPQRDYAYTYFATGAFLDFPGQQSGLVSFNLELETTVFSMEAPTVTLSDFILRDYNLVPSNELLSTSSRMKSDAVIAVRSDH